MAWQQSVSYRVLVADHDTTFLEAYRQSFPARLWEFAGAASGLECVEQLRRFQPHVLVLEPAIPWGGGAGILAQMHCETDVPLVPVIVLTACRQFAELSGVLRFPLHDFAFKPLSSQDLAYKIRHAVNDLPLDSEQLSCGIRQTLEGMSTKRNGDGGAFAARTRVDGPPPKPARRK